MEHSKMYAKIKRFYDMGLWTAEMVEEAVVKGLLRADEAAEIVGKEEVRK